MCNQAIKVLSPGTLNAKNMLQDLIARGFAKKDIANQTRISMSTIKRVLKHDTLNLNAATFNKLLRFYWQVRQEAPP